MFYLLEVFFRIKYLIISFFVTTLLCYINKDLLFFLLTFNTLSSNYKTHSPAIGVDYFIYTHPLELLLSYLFVILYFSLIFSLHALLWSTLDFFRSSMNKSNFSTFCRGLNSFIFFILLSNVAFVIFLFPSFWFYFQSFNESLSQDVSLSFFLELKIKDYFLFLKSVVLTMNLGFILIFALQLLIDSQNLLSLLTWKKGLILTNFILSTFLLSSDLLTQVFEIILLTIFLEVTIFARILTLKFRKFFVH